MKNNYIFSSERLGFRNWSHDDLDEFGMINADPFVMEHFPKPLTRQETAEFIDRLQAHFSKHGFNYFAVEVKATKELIGFIGLAHQDYESHFNPAVDIGWRLKKSAWGKGYATEGAKRCLKYAFEELKLDRVVSVCTAQNLKSESVMQKIGMTKKGEFDHPKLKEYPVSQLCLWYEILLK